MMPDIKGFMPRVTEWHDGFQACAFRRSDIRDHVVSAWHKTEADAWDEVWAMLIAKGWIDEDASGRGHA